MFWQTSRFRIDLARPQVMGIVNVTPDSFFDGGAHAEFASAVAHCELLASQGADILDIGGESTRPGSIPPSLEEEVARVIPVVAEAVKLGIPVSVDTSRADVMARALDLGADIINDIRALSSEGALAVCAGHPTVGICLMHMQGQPATMQDNPQYSDVVREVIGFLEGRVAAVHAQGVASERIVLDPGYGFGKSKAHNLTLFRRQDELLQLGLPLLVGWSRKGLLGKLTGRDTASRLVPSIAAALAAVERGARIVRVHDVADTVDALKIWHAAGLGASRN
jgi:dihydropteroate synthase